MITVSYIEELIGREFMYTDWVVQLLPFGIAVTVVTLVFLLMMKDGQKLWMALESTLGTCTKACRL